MFKSQNPTVFVLLLTVVLTLSTGCQLAKFPKMPDMGIWKKDVFRLSKSNKDSVAPPSRTFDPEPSHFANMDGQRDSGRGVSPDQYASRENNPTREPYKIEGETSEPSNFGFPSNSKSLMGDEEIAMPKANDFRQAMDRASEGANQFVANAKQTADQTLQGAKDFTSNQIKSANDFVAGGGDFIAKTSQNAIAKTNEIARNAMSAAQPKWKTDFELPKPEMKGLGGAASQVANNDFQPSVNRAANQAKEAVGNFQRNAQNQLNSGIRATQQAANNMAQNASSNINRSLTRAAGQFEQSWQDSVQQAKQAAGALQDAQAFRNTQPVSQNGFQPASSTPASTNSSFANQSVQGTLEVAQGGALNADRPSTGSQFASTGAGSFQPKSQPVAQPAAEGPIAPGAVAKSNSMAQHNPANASNAGNNYPSTNYSPYRSQGRERISKVTPIENPVTPVLRAQPRTKADTEAARTAGLPAELMQGNSNYAPGSVKPLSPLR